MTIASFTALVHAEQQNVLPKLTSSMRVEDLTHSQHTRDALGHFKHPFLNAPSELQTISYPQSGSFSTKLHRVEGVSRRTDRTVERALGKGGVQKKQSSIWERFVKLFLEDYQAKIYTTPLDNKDNFNYVGQVWIGTPH